MFQIWPEPGSSTEWYQKIPILFKESCTWCATSVFLLHFSGSQEKQHYQLVFCVEPRFEMKCFAPRTPWRIHGTCITYLPPFKHMAIFSIFFVKFQVILPSHRIHWTGTFIYLLISNKDQPFMKVNIQASLGAGLDNGNSTSDSLAFLHSQNSCTISHVIGLAGSGKCRILKGHTDPRHPNTEHEMVNWTPTPHGKHQSSIRYHWMSSDRDPWSIIPGPWKWLGSPPFLRHGPTTLFRGLTITIVASCFNSLGWSSKDHPLKKNPAISDFGVFAERISPLDSLQTLGWSSKLRNKKHWRPGSCFRVCCFVGFVGGSESEELIDSLPLFDFGAEVSEKIIVDCRWSSREVLVFFLLNLLMT